MYKSWPRFDDDDIGDVYDVDDKDDKDDKDNDDKERAVWGGGGGVIQVWRRQWQGGGRGWQTKEEEE